MPNPQASGGGNKIPPPSPIQTQYKDPDRPQKFKEWKDLTLWKKITLTFWELVARVRTS